MSTMSTAEIAEKLRAAGILAIERWACFARYTSPIESARRWRPKKVQVPIYMSGTTPVTCGSIQGIGSWATATAFW